MNVMPCVVVKTNDYARLVKNSLVVVTESKECESLLVSIVVFVDAGYTQIQFAVKDRLLVEIQAIDATAAASRRE
jgi:hypothetical protein